MARHDLSFRKSVRCALLLLIALNGCREQSKYQYSSSSSTATEQQATTPTQEESRVETTGNVPAISTHVSDVPAAIPDTELLEGFPATVTRIKDGDTIVIVDDKHRMMNIRIEGIDAPEKNQRFGSESRQNLMQLAFRKRVEVIPRSADRNHRLVAKILAGSTDVGLAQIETGMAWHYKHFEIEQTPADRSAYAAAEIAARGSRLGLWSDTEPLAPWMFRHPGLQETARVATEIYDGHVIANRTTREYFLPGCRGYTRTPPTVRMRFVSEHAATEAGFRRSTGC